MSPSWYRGVRNNLKVQSRYSSPNHALAFETFSLKPVDSAGDAMDKDPLDKLDRSGRLALLTRWLIDGCGAIAGILLVISVAATSYAIYEISQEGSVQPSEVKATPLSPSPQCFKSVTGQNVRPSGSEAVTRGSEEIVSRPKLPPMQGLEEIRQHLRTGIPNCTLLTRSCSSKAFLKEHKLALESLPNLSPGALGTCALVGAGDTLLAVAKGDEIDAHDTVVRFNSPVSKFSEVVGKKTTMLWLKEKYSKQDLDEGQKAKYIVVAKSRYKKYRKQPRRVLAMRRNEQVADLGMKLYWTYEKATNWKRAKRRRPTTGFKRVITMIGSGLCSRIDLYGFSSGGGKYFARNSFPRGLHIYPAEHLAYRVLMEENQVCIYED
ncbi:hypothetical protein CYMTET_42853 [Cymbomonas tetramitiformis]|uniref:Uncharacterized protein n=1 Tax=Cymbomonas tetramitiformis TaxID=36881 RepID=A0AAE0C3B3_9CHLO|nr:hypothetical protein CYMTET_42853 [Cymbomonas tetramitiformis]